MNGPITRWRYWRFGRGYRKIYGPDDPYQPMTLKTDDQMRAEAELRERCGLGSAQAVLDACGIDRHGT